MSVEYVVAFRDSKGRLNHITKKAGVTLDPTFARKWKTAVSAETEASRLNGDAYWRGVGSPSGWSVYA